MSDLLIQLCLLCQKLKSLIPKFTFCMTEQGFFLNEVFWAFVGTISIHTLSIDWKSGKRRDPGGFHHISTNLFLLETPLTLPLFSTVSPVPIPQRLLIPLGTTLCPCETSRQEGNSTEGVRTKFPCGKYLHFIYIVLGTASGSVLRVHPSSLTEP